MDSSTIVTAAIVVFSMLVMRMGITATLSVLALAFLLLCHPAVRTFFEMALPDQGGQQDSTQRDHETAEALRLRAHGVTKSIHARSEAGDKTERMDLSSLPPALQPELRHLLRLVRADFVQYWFDPLSFGSPSFPDEAMASAEHLLVQVALRLEQYSCATVVTELALTALSVLVTAMQNRRTSSVAHLGLWPTTERRIQSLRSSVSMLLQQSLPPEDSRSPMVVELLTDMLAKQLWEQLQSHSDPDVLNQYIVLYGQAAATGRLSEGKAPSAPPAPPEAPANSAPRAPTASACVGELLHDLEDHNTADEKVPQSSLPDDLREVLSALKDPTASDVLTEPPAPSAETSFPAEPWSKDTQQAQPMNVPPGLPEPPWPPPSEAHRYQVRLPKKVRDVMAQRDSELYDEWYQYMARQDPDASPCEGAVLLQLNSNLDALAASFDQASALPLYTSDVKAVLQAAHGMLPSHKPCEEVHNAIESLQASESIDPSKLEPLRVALVRRLQQLYDAFLADVKNVRAESPPSRPSSRGTYEPRRSRRTPTAADTARNISVLDVSEHAEQERIMDLRTWQVLVTMEDVSAGAGGYAVLRTGTQLEALHTELTRMYEKLPNDSSWVPPPTLPSLKGMSSAEACEAVRQYLGALLVPSEHTLAWYNTAQVVQRFLDKTRAADEDAKLKNYTLMTSLGGVSRSLASGLAGAAGSARKSMGQIAPTPSRASRIFGLRPDLSDTRRTLPLREPPELPARPLYQPLREVVSTPVPSAARQDPAFPPNESHAGSAEHTEPPTAPAKEPNESAKEPTEPQAPGPSAPAPPPPTPAESQATVQDVHALLTAVFAVTREALNMHEAWTLQRGMLRVIEQFLRTTYYGTVTDLVTYLASLLSLDAQVSWLQLLRTTLWPNDTWATHSATPARSAAEVQATADAARAVVLSYVPPQSAYALGLGGKQAVVDALATVHGVVTDPVVSLDLHLALLLRVLDLAMGTAGAPSGDRA
ncbi:hypothetical protein MNAN1_002158 [Malassezia nana]|uniref:PXA domain-containing protein n=1 Tax=Malassezia nana TaxID=180528 RepID=A0AAF0EIT9_9BASI|nr:hypothetical protein MNAN1_002158 [Malassezia nana]